MLSAPPLLGAHFATSDGLAAMVYAAIEAGANCAQIFTSSPQQWRGKLHKPEEVAKFRAALVDTGFGPIISHDSYLVNPASPDAVILAKSRAAFREEIARCAQLGIGHIVMHWGAYKETTPEAGLQTLAETLTGLLPVADAAGVQILLETTAGQGTTLGSSFAQYAQLFALIPEHAQIGACLDTCHIFAAGYDIRTADGYEQVLAEFDKYVGLQRLKVIHMNDTASAPGSHLDRHAHIGTAQLGDETFRRIINDPRLLKVAKILETPEGIEMHTENIARLRGLWAG
ncbi:MAG: deoxyribonuclease IV [bacterium]